MPEISNKTVKVDINLIDETFYSSQSENYHLSLQTEPNRLSFCVFDTVVNKYIVLRNYLLNSIDLCALVSECSFIFENDDLLSLKYKSSSHLWISPRFTFVPEHLFDPKERDSYLTFTHGAIDGELILQNHIKTVSMYNIFSCPEALMTLLRLYQPKISFYHQSTPFIESVVAGMSSSGGAGLAVYYYNNWLDIVVVKDNKILFYNTFQITAPEDSVYYLVGISNLFHIDLPKTKLMYAGDFKHIPPEVAILKNYVERIVECEPPHAVLYSYHIPEAFRKNFINLINMHRCES